MKILNIQNHSTHSPKEHPNFSAKKWADIEVLKEDKINKFELFKIDNKDKESLFKLANSINLEKFLPTNTPQQIISKYHAIINNGIFLASLGSFQDSFLLAQEKKPCGLIVYYKDVNKNAKLEFVASWSPNNNTKPRGAGTALISYMFDDVSKNKTDKIFLEIVNESIINLKDFYKKFGFKHSTNKDNQMFATKYVYLEQMNKIRNFVNITENPTKKDIDLSEELNILL